MRPPAIWGRRYVSGIAIAPIDPAEIRQPEHAEHRGDDRENIAEDSRVAVELVSFPRVAQAGALGAAPNAMPMNSETDRIIARLNFAPARRCTAERAEGMNPSADAERAPPVSAWRSCSRAVHPRRRPDAAAGERDRQTRRDRHAAPARDGQLQPARERRRQEAADDDSRDLAQQPLAPRAAWTREVPREVRVRFGVRRRDRRHGARRRGRECARRAEPASREDERGEQHEAERDARRIRIRILSAGLRPSASAASNSSRAPARPSPKP
jgi:hypothetical protein